MFNFGPKSNIRSLDVRSLIGHEGVLRFQHTDADNKIRRAKWLHEDATKKWENDPDTNPKPAPYVEPKPEPTSQYVSLTVYAPWLIDHPTGKVTVCDWVGLVQPSDTKLTCTVSDAWLLEANNGGRSDYRRYNTYAEFYNEERKQRCYARWKGGLAEMLRAGGGDPDGADICIEVQVPIDGHNFKLVFESRHYEMREPGEWYSEVFCADRRFRCADGFYPDGDSACAVCANKAQDDIFGTRFFPVISIPVDHENAEKLGAIAHSVKSCSKPIVANGRLFYGLRCKPYEYASAIKRTYDMGGQVPVGLDWDWE